MGQRARRQSARSQSSRRRFCRALGTAAAVGLAGCLGDDSSDDTTPSDGDEESDVEVGDGLERAPAANWPMQGYDPANTGHHPTTTGPDAPVSAQWKLDVSASGTPAVADGTVFAGGAAGVLYAIDAVDGTIEWEYDEPPTELYSSTAAVDGAVYFTDEGSPSGATLYALDAANGDELWTQSLESQNGTSPVVVDGPDGRTVYASSNEHLLAVDAASGEPRWHVESPVDGESERAGFGSSAAVVDDTVYVAGQAGLFYAIDASDGSERWRADVGPDDWIITSPTVEDGAVFVGTSSSEAVALDAATGAELWRTSSINSLGLAVVDGTVFSTVGGGLTALDADTGESLWDGESSGWSASAPVVVDGTVYHSAAPDVLLAHDETTGELEWEFDGVPGTDNRPGTPVVVDGVVFYGDPSGFYALTEE